MKLNSIQFLDIDEKYTDLDQSAVAILPFPYEGGVSFGKGTSKAPDAVLKASAFLELYDEVLEAEPYRMGISTIASPEMPDSPEEMIELLYKQTKTLIDLGKFVAVIGGDHSISSGYFRALTEKYKKVSCIQLDAHSDLRNEYEGSIYSHASVMARIREMTTHTLQLGIRSMEAAEAHYVKQSQLDFYTMHQMRYGNVDLDAAIKKLPDPVFITVDVDVFDWSVVRSTGTPEPGGVLWYEAMDILYKIFKYKNVVGFDIVELSNNRDDINSTFAVAKLLYKMLGFKLKNYVDNNKAIWPLEPAGPIFSDNLPLSS